MLKRLLPALALGAVTASLPTTSLAQTPINLTRATNLARMEAERLNGGLTKYFAANCMHQRDGGSCLIESGPNGYLYQFLGGPPGWEVNKLNATVESRVLVSADGLTVLKVEYNGKPR